VIVEYIRYLVPPDQAPAFEQAYERAGLVLDRDEHCLHHEVGRGVEEPQRFVVRIEWDSVDGHEQGFRRSRAFGEFFAHVRPFFGQIEEMAHYRVTSPAK
jgi:heme-degrading monooxygenase HmoA